MFSNPHDCQHADQPALPFHTMLLDRVRHQRLLQDLLHNLLDLTLDHPRMRPEYYDCTACQALDRHSISDVAACLMRIDQQFWDLCGPDSIQPFMRLVEEPEDLLKLPQRLSVHEEELLEGLRDEAYYLQYDALALQVLLAQNALADPSQELSEWLTQQIDELDLNLPESPDLLAVVRAQLDLDEEDWAHLLLIGTREFEGYQRIRDALPQGPPA